MKYKKCTGCEETKPLTEEFFVWRNDRKRFDGAKCKKCLKSQSKKYRKKNKTKIYAYMHAYREENKSEIKTQTRQYRETTKGRYIKCKNKSKERNIELKLSYEEFEKLALLPCYYCEGKLGTVGAGVGLDRINNNIGYIKDNVLPCCSTCNFIKGCFFTLPVTKFIINFLINYRFGESLNVKNTITLNDAEDQIKIFDKYRNGQDFVKNYTLNQRFNFAKNKAKSRGISFELNFKDYADIVKYDCYYCNGKIAYVKGGSGLDRLDNNGGYTIDNTVSCCGICNKMKLNLLTSEESKAIINNLIKYLNIN